METVVIHLEWYQTKLCLYGERGHPLGVENENATPALLHTRDGAEGGVVECVLEYNLFPRPKVCIISLEFPNHNPVELMVNYKFEAHGVVFETQRSRVVLLAVLSLSVYVYKNTGIFVCGLSGCALNSCP